MIDDVARARRFFEAIPHCKALGIKLDTMGGGQADLVLPYGPHLIGDPDTGIVHGGAVSTVIDTCCGTAVMCHPDIQGVTATIDLRIDYMRAATPGQAIRTSAVCHHVGRSVAFVRAVATDDDAERPVATAAGAFTVERR